MHSGPALAGHGAEVIRWAIAAAMGCLPEQLRRSLTSEQGAEMAQRDQIHAETGAPIYFCEPRSPWQRGTNESTNGLPGQYFPKGTDLSRDDPDDLTAVASAVNGPPRTILGWRTPAEALDELMCSVARGGAATIP